MSEIPQDAIEPQQLTAVNTDTSSPSSSSLVPPTLPPPPLPATSAEPTTCQPTVDGTPFEIECLLMNGQRKRWLVGSEETVEVARDRIWRDWAEWKSSQEAPLHSPDSLRLIYLGKILELSKQLSAYGLGPPVEPGDPPSIVHLHIRTIPIDPDSNDPIKKPKRRSSSSNRTSPNRGPNNSSSSSWCRCCIIS